MSYIVNTATLQKLHIGQDVYANGKKGVIKEIRDNCKFPIFVQSDGVIDAYLWCEVKAA